MSYVYKDPLKNGYKQFRLTRKQHNKLFEYRQLKWFYKYEYYHNDESIIMHRFYNIFGIVENTLLFPLYILLEGLKNIKEVSTEFKQLFNQKKYGSFSGDDIWCDSEKYKEIMKIINEKEC